MNTNLMNLIPDVLMHILSFAPKATAMQLPYVSKAFSEMVNSNECWNTIADRNGIRHLTLDTPHEQLLINLRCKHFLRALNHCLRGVNIA